MYILRLALVLFSAQLLGQMSCDEALQNLKDGNIRFATDASIHPNRVSERREELTHTQAPFAAIVGCSDSRVSPEIIFDQGIGDLFIIRVAGNVVGPLEMDSIDYAAIYLHSCLIVVLGHENCGAVDAVLKGTTKDIEAVAKLVAPAVKKAGGGLEATIKANVQQVVSQIQASKTLKSLFDQKKLTVVGGYYNFHTGKVEFLEK
jgi:carbonic anhydrase